jgi:hypothetical protein
MRRRLGVCWLAALLPWPAGAQDIVRCEDPRGRVTYATPPCPTGTREVRTLTAPPPPDPAAAEQARQQTDREVERMRQQREQAALDEARAREQERQRNALDCERLRTDIKATRQARAYLVTRPYYSMNDRDQIDARLKLLEVELSRRCTSR